jgi:hypothetical protein
MLEARLGSSNETIEPRDQIRAKGVALDRLAVERIEREVIRAISRVEEC